MCLYETKVITGALGIAQNAFTPDGDSEVMLIREHIFSQSHCCNWTWPWWPVNSHSHAWWLNVMVWFSGWSVPLFFLLSTLTSLSLSVSRFLSLGPSLSGSSGGSLIAWVWLRWEGWLPEEGSRTARCRRRPTVITRLWREVRLLRPSARKGREKKRQLPHDPTRRSADVRQH